MAFFASLSTDLMADPFIYTRGPIWVGAGAEVCSLPPGLDAKAEVLAEILEQLRFPTTLQATWDDLEQGLQDLAWLDADTVVLLHHEVPRLPKNTLAVYLDILRDVTLLRLPGTPRLVVVFPDAAQERVCELLRIG